ncbi:MAG: sugar phosphate isomerase/epimerase [Firmicutes bacterium]|nr:sugar phosphate isomerase/epimerase [Bacillota bacterium]
MKISFSTLGCPRWSWDEIVVMAKDFGFDGIEVRGIGNEIHVPLAKPFLPKNLENTKSRLSNLGLEIPCLTSPCNLSDKCNIDAVIKEGKEYINLAAKLGVPYVRMLGDPNPHPEENIDFNFTVENLSIMTDYAGSKKVKVLMETNGKYADSNIMLQLIDTVNSPSVGVLWDIHHTYRFFSEPVTDTYNALGKYIEFIHIKDSIMINGQVKYKMMGYGDVPVKEALLLLKNNGYKGYVSLEWVKRWCTDLEEPGIVFSHFINYVRQILKDG